MGILDELYIRKKIRKILREGSEEERKSSSNDASGPKKIGVSVADLTVRDGVYYMVHTINGAINAGSLDLTGWDVDVEKAARAYCWF